MNAAHHFFQKYHGDAQWLSRISIEQLMEAYHAHRIQEAQVTSYVPTLQYQGNFEEQRKHGLTVNLGVGEK
jgi:hypothetical protein